MIEPANTDSKSYVIGPLCFEIGISFSRRNNLLAVAGPYAELLMQACNTTSFIAGLYNDKILYLDKKEAKTSVRTSAELGSANDLYSSGLGKSILASYTNESIGRMFASSSISAHTPYTLTTLAALMEDIEKTRKRGYAIDNREADINVYCIASPIYDSSNTAVAAISIALLYTSDVVKYSDNYGSLVSQYALEISHKLGYTGSLYDHLDEKIVPGAVEE